jgi:predicted transcriptional regulator
MKLRDLERRMKTAGSMDKLFRRADAFARHFRKSRRQVHREGLAEYLARREPDAVAAALNDVMNELGSAPDAWSVEASRAALERSE